MSKFQVVQITSSLLTYLIGQNFVRQNFVGQNISSDKIFDTKPKFRHFCLIFAWLLYWNIGQSFRLTKFFVRQNLRHQAEISTILSHEFLSDKVYNNYLNLLCLAKQVQKDYSRKQIFANDTHALNLLCNDNWIELPVEDPLNALPDKVALAHQFLAIFVYV